MSWKGQFELLKSRMQDYDTSQEAEHDDDDDRPEPLDTMVTILEDTCKLLRDAREQNIDDFVSLFDEANELINDAVAGYVKDADGPAYIKSFAHSPNTLLDDPWSKMMWLESMRDMLEKLANILGGGPGKLDEYFSSSGAAIVPWDKEQQPHPASAVLSRFRENIVFPSSATHPRATYVWQARCEVINDTVHVGDKLVLSADGSFLAMSGAGGWKNRDPIVYYSPGRTDDLHTECLDPRLAHLIEDIVLDDARQLLFVADSDRIKSFSFAPHTRKRAVHTLDAHTHGGPLMILPNDRVLRAGKGSALMWNIDELETHYPGTGEPYKKIGKGTYQGFEDSWRDEDCEQELSVGSVAHTTVTFADSEYTPETWHLHTPSGKVLCAEDTMKIDHFECALLDLEHGGKVAARYVGHAEQVHQFSSSAGDPHTFLTACGDGYARLYDMREPLPVITIDGEAQNGSMDSAVLVHIDGLPAVFTGGTSTQNVKLWDIRAGKVVYELSTGNTDVRSLVWSAPDTELYASTSCQYVDRMGGLHDYRKARIAKPKRSAADHEVADEDEDEDWEDEDEDDEDFDDDDDGSEFGGMNYDGLRWPKRAYHQENFFGKPFDCGSDALFRYSFGEDPSTDVCPVSRSTNY